MTQFTLLSNNAHTLPFDHVTIGTWGAVHFIFHSLLSFPLPLSFSLLVPVLCIFPGLFSLLQFSKTCKNITCSGCYLLYPFRPLLALRLCEGSRTLLFLFVSFRSFSGSFFVHWVKQMIFALFALPVTGGGGGGLNNTFFKTKKSLFSVASP